MDIPPPTLGIEYRKLEEYPGYCFGEDGSVWSRWKVGGGGGLGYKWKKKAQAPSRNKRYLSVCLNVDYNGNHTVVHVHKLILKAFTGDCPQGMQCRHLDGNPHNNAKDNLKWGTCQENMDDREKHGRTSKGEHRHSAILTEEQVKLIRASSLTSASIARQLKMGVTIIDSIRKRRKWKHVD